MKDIDILEEYLDKQDRKYVSEYRLMILNAIETLISENKELKEELRNHNIEIVRKQIENLYIPKSKVEEKIEEKRKPCKECRFAETFCEELCKNGQCVTNEGIKYLQELLETNDNHIPHID